MNQILITKKLYITPELKRKKKIYKFDFILSIFLVIILTSIYIYAEYDKNKSEEVSQEILAKMESTLAEKKDETTAKSNVLIAILNAEEDDETPSIPVQMPQETQQQKSNATSNTQSIPKQVTESGYKYTIDAKITVPKIGIEYSVILGETGTIEEIEDLLKKSPVKFHGCNPNEVGNYCIVGHNYRNKRFFSKVPTLENGDTINITDMSGRTITYAVYDKYTVVPEDTSCTTQLTNGKKEITLITCTDDSKLRVIVKAREIK